jgi:hypothetical protein
MPKAVLAALRDLPSQVIAVELARGFDASTCVDPRDRPGRLKSWA